MRTPGKDTDRQAAISWLRAVAVWLGLAVLMIAHGWARELFAAPALGPLRAHQLSSLTGALIIVAVSALTLRLPAGRAPAAKAAG